MPFAVLLAALAEVPDPRRAQGQRYSMRHLLLFSVLAVLAGATSYQGIVTFIGLQRDRLNTVFGACFRRAPAVNTLRHLFLVLDRDDLEAAFRRHACALNAGTPGVLRTDEGREAVGLAPEERFVALIHLGHPVQEKAAPEREPAASVVSYLD